MLSILNFLQITEIFITDNVCGVRDKYEVCLFVRDIALKFKFNPGPQGG